MRMVQGVSGEPLPHQIDLSCQVENGHALDDLIAQQGRPYEFRLIACACWQAIRWTGGVIWRQWRDCGRSWSLWWHDRRVRIAYRRGRP